MLISLYANLFISNSKTVSDTLSRFSLMYSFIFLPPSNSYSRQTRLPVSVPVVNVVAPASLMRLANY
ncbi:MAG: hypothetical protein ACLRFN_01175 [Alphaproteobacteria bacterium]